MKWLIVVSLFFCPLAQSSEEWLGPQKSKYDDYWVQTPYNIGIILSSVAGRNCSFRFTFYLAGSANSPDFFETESAFPIELKIDDNNTFSAKADREFSVKSGKVLSRMQIWPGSKLIDQLKTGNTLHVSYIADGYHIDQDVSLSGSTSAIDAAFTMCRAEHPDTGKVVPEYTDQIAEIGHSATTRDGNASKVSEKALSDFEVAAYAAAMVEACHAIREGYLTVFLSEPEYQKAMSAWNRYLKSEPVPKADADRIIKEAQSIGSFAEMAGMAGGKVTRQGVEECKSNALMLYMLDSQISLPDI